VGTACKLSLRRFKEVILTVLCTRYCAYFWDNCAYFFWDKYSYRDEDTSEIDTWHG